MCESTFLSLNRFECISNGMLWFVYLDPNGASVKNEREQISYTKYVSMVNAICAHMLHHQQHGKPLKTDA